MDEREEQLMSAIRMGRVKEIPNLVAVMAEHEAAMRVLDAQPLVEPEKRKQRNAAAAALRSRVVELVAAARVEALKGFDEEEGAVRKAARADDLSDVEVRRTVALATKASLLSQQVDRADSPRAARRLYDEALLAGDSEVIRVVGASVKQRLAVLAAADAGKDVSQSRNELIGFDQEFGRWRKANPSATERLAEITRRRENAAILFQASADFALELFDVPTAAATLRPVPDRD